MSEEERWLHEAVKDASERAAKNASLPGRPVTPELLYAPILWAFQDALDRQPKPLSES